ncbi:MAG: TonB C-terminal domain-containing protein, partial [Granulosicoccaceae bacterium]
ITKEKAAEEERQRLEAEAEAKRIAEEKAAAEAERKRIAAEKAAAEAKRKAEAAAKRKAEIKKLAQLKQRYLRSIQQRVERKWINRGFGDDVSCIVRARQIPSGEIIDVTVVSCSGGGVELERSVERAVLKSSPLPSVPDPRLFERVIEFVFAPQ